MAAKPELNIAVSLLEDVELGKPETNSSD